MKYLPNITPLRFVLAALVIVFHVPQFFSNQGIPYFNEFPVFHKGMEAVYMFHVIAMHLTGFLAISDLIVIISYTIAVIVLTIVFAHFSYNDYESCFLRLKTKFSTIA